MFNNPSDKLHSLFHNTTIFYSSSRSLSVRIPCICIPLFHPLIILNQPASSPQTQKIDISIQPPSPWEHQTLPTYFKDPPLRLFVTIPRATNLTLPLPFASARTPIILLLLHKRRSCNSADGTHRPLVTAFLSNQSSEVPTVLHLSSAC